MPEEITALAVSTGQPPELTGKVFIGTTPVGGVYSFNLLSPDTYLTIGVGLGDYTRFGMCDVNSLAIKDLDKDGSPELLATTSQIVPRGRPRLYAWSLSNPPVLRGMSRPDIQSSWSHGIGFLESPGAPSLSTYVTFCGYGEIVEYQLASSTNKAGFAEVSLGWKNVGQLPVSGEWIQSNDVDHDGQTELCVATGFAPGKTAIHIYTGDRPGAHSASSASSTRPGDSATSGSWSATRGATASRISSPGGARSSREAIARSFATGSGRRAFASERSSRKDGRVILAQGWSDGRDGSGRKWVP